MSGHPNSIRLHGLKPSLFRPLNVAAERAAKKIARFVGRGFSHDVIALDSSGVLTPEARK
jgi:hypothetical protein